MDNLGNNDLNKPIPFDDSDKPIPLGEAPTGDSPGVSRAPLNLGGGGSAKPPASAPRPAQAPRPAPAKQAPAGRPPTPKIVTSTPITKTGGHSVSSGERITGMKTFFAKLHAGALEFLDEQINDWLKDNPDVRIKHTNITTGDVQAKKTEPNILITVWY